MCVCVFELMRQTADEAKDSSDSASSLRISTNATIYSENVPANVLRWIWFATRAGIFIVFLFFSFPVFYFITKYKTVR